jgi:uncharacterized membrane protein YphA (DoxX/SURF4 family)
MDFRNKYLVNTIRILLGLLFLFSGASGFYSATHNWMGVPPDMVPANDVLWHTGIFQIIKSTEIVGGLMLIVGFLPWIALLAFAPLCIGILVTNALTYPAALPLGAIVTLATIYLAYVYWDKYKGLFQR